MKHKHYKYPNRNCGYCARWLAYGEPDTSEEVNREIEHYCNHCCKEVRQHKIRCTLKVIASISNILWIICGAASLLLSFINLDHFTDYTLIGMWVFLLIKIVSGVSSDMYSN